MVVVLPLKSTSSFLPQDSRPPEKNNQQFFLENSRVSTCIVSNRTRRRKKESAATEAIGKCRMCGIGHGQSRKQTSRRGNFRLVSIGRAKTSWRTGRTPPFSGIDLGFPCGRASFVSAKSIARRAFERGKPWKRVACTSYATPSPPTPMHRCTQAWLDPCRSKPAS